MYAHCERMRSRWSIH